MSLKGLSKQHPRADKGVDERPIARTQRHGSPNQQTSLNNYKIKTEKRNKMVNVLLAKQKGCKIMTSLSDRLRQEKDYNVKVVFSKDKAINEAFHGSGYDYFIIDSDLPQKTTTHSGIDQLIYLSPRFSGKVHMIYNMNDLDLDEMVEKMDENIDEIQERKRIKT